MASIWCNGTFGPDDETLIAITDRGFTLADGIFETLRATGSTPLWLAEHLKRLRASARFLGLHIAHEDADIAAAIATLLSGNGFGQSAVRITLTRGPTSKRGLWSSDNPDHPTLLITVAPAGQMPPQKMVICRSTRRNEHSPLSGIKSLNYGDNILARREAIQRGASDALMLNTQGHVACATVGNVFFRVDGAWVTPALSSGVLAGIARAKIIPQLNASERILTEQDIARTDAAFISNSLGCAAIANVEDRVLQQSAMPESIYEK
jgi:branched-chain amino acid aminotransferase